MQTNRKGRRKRKKLQTSVKVSTKQSHKAKPRRTVRCCSEFRMCCAAGTRETGPHPEKPEDSDVNLFSSKDKKQLFDHFFF